MTQVFYIQFSAQVSSFKHATQLSKGMALLHLIYCRDPQGPWKFHLAACKHHKAPVLPDMHVHIHTHTWIPSPEFYSSASWSGLALESHKCCLISGRRFSLLVCESFLDRWEAETEFFFLLYLKELTLIMCLCSLMIPTFSWYVKGCWFTSSQWYRFP